jgi:hypothetical protein
MNLPVRTLSLKRLLLKDKPVLALDTGFAADSLEGLRLVKASRGSGWFWHEGTLRPWVTKGVIQEDRRLVVWGDLDPIPEGVDPGPWPVSGAEGRDFVKALVIAWTARAAAEEPLPAFSSSAVLPWRVGEGWAFVFPPFDLRGVLDSLQPLSERLPWEHFRHPELTGAAHWAFASAALGLHVVTGSLPWAQDSEEHLRQELRDLKRTFLPAELPVGPDGTTLQLWADSLTGRVGTRPEARWKAWAAEEHLWNAGAADPAADQKRAAARQKRERRRSGAAFWRRKGTLVTALALTGAVLVAIVGSVVWGAVKPDPTDLWSPEQVVQGYYAAIDDMDSDLMHKLTRFDDAKEVTLRRDQEEATNLYVIRQVRTAYEHKSPVLLAEDWEAAGKPVLVTGQMLYGLAGLTLTHDQTQWTAHYRKWTSEGDETGARAQGVTVTDVLTLVQTSRGWKVSSLTRDRQPLP